MASISIVEYLLKMGGSLPKDAKDASEAIDRVERSADKAKSGIEKLGRMAGGPLGQITDAAADATDVLDALGASVGGVGLAAGAAAVGLAGLAVGSKALADAAVEAADRLEKQGLASAIPEASLASVVAYKEASAELRNEVDLLTVAIAGPALDALTQIADVTSGATGAFLDARDAATSWRESVEELGVPVSETKSFVEGLGTAMITLGLSIPFKAFADYMGDVREMKQATIELNAEVAKGMEAFARGHVLPALVAGGGPAVPDLSSLPMSGEDMMAALGMTSSGKPAKKGSASSTPAGDPDALAKLIVREGNMAAASAAGDARAQARTDAFLEGLDLTTEGVHELIDELQANQDAIDRLNATTGRAAQESMAQTRGMVSSLIGFGTDIATLPGQIDGFVRSIPALATGFVKDFESVLSAWPDAVDQLLKDLPGVLVESAPKMALSFVTMGPRLGLAMAGAFVDGFKALFSADFWKDLGRGLVDAIEEALASLNPFQGKGGDPFGTDLTPGRGERAKFLGIEIGKAAKGQKLPSFDAAFRHPMQISQTGLAVVHRGEEIGRSGALRGATNNFYVTATDPDDFVRKVQRILGSYGTGASLAARP